MKKKCGFDYVDYVLDGVLGDKTEEEYEAMVLAEKALADEAVLGKSVGDAVRLGGKDLRVFHIHDNDGKDDRHYFPGMGVIDWKDFMASVKEIEFDGVLCLEVGPCKGFFPGISDEARMQVLQTLYHDIVNG